MTTLSTAGVRVRVGRRAHGAPRAQRAQHGRRAGALARLAGGGRAVLRARLQGAPVRHARAGSQRVQSHRSGVHERLDESESAGGGVRSGGVERRRVVGGRRDAGAAHRSLRTADASAAVRIRSTHRREHTGVRRARAGRVARDLGCGARLATAQVCEGVAADGARAARPAGARAAGARARPGARARVRAAAGQEATHTAQVSLYRCTERSMDPVSIS